MEENNTGYIETGIEPGTEETSFYGYLEETAETETGTAMEENTETEIGTDTGENVETEESGDNGNDVFDSTDSNASDISYSTDSNANDGNVSDAETNISPSSGASPDDAGNVSDATDGDLLESLNALVEALSPKEDAESGETGGTGTDESILEPQISEYDTQTLEALQGIQSTLVSMQAENELWHTETLKYREETRKTQESIIVHLEFASLLLIAVGFFVALQCGGKFADIFFKRMKGDCRNE